MRDRERREATSQRDLDPRHGEGEVLRHPPLGTDEELVGADVGDRESGSAVTNAWPPPAKVGHPISSFRLVRAKAAPGWASRGGGAQCTSDPSVVRLMLGTVAASPKLTNPDAPSLVTPRVSTATLPWSPSHAD